VVELNDKVLSPDEIYTSSPLEVKPFRAIRISDSNKQFVPTRGKLDAIINN